MRKLIILVIVAATLYGGYWFVGRAQIQDKLTEALVQVDAGEYSLNYGTLNTRGFPSRFDTTITELKFSDPATPMTWQAPTFRLFALSYRPNEVIAVFPNEQTLTLNDTEYTLVTRDMRASGKVRANASLAFQAATVDLDNPRIRTVDGAELAMAGLLAAMRLSPQTTQTYDVFFEARSIVLPEDIRRQIDPQDQQPAVIQSLRFDSDVDLSAPIALNGGTDAPLLVKNLNITEFGLTWGDMSVSAIGDVAVDARGVLDGSITVTASNWEQAIDLAVAMGAIPDERRYLITEIANNMDETPDFADTLTITLSVTDGEMALGEFALGPAPLLR